MVAIVVTVVVAFIAISEMVELKAKAIARNDLQGEE